MTLFIVSGILQLIITPIILSYSSSRFEIYSGLIGVALHSVLAAIAFFDIQFYALLTYSIPILLWFVSTYMEAERVAMGYKSYARFNTYLIVAGGIALSHVIVVWILYS